MKLYYAPGACSLAPHIVVREGDLAVDLVKVEFGKDSRTAGGRDYYQINPKGAVPALELDDGQVLTENAVLLQYLAGKSSDAELAPREGMARWRLLELLNYIATEVHKGFGPLFNSATPPEARELAIANLHKKFDFLQGKLGDGPWLTGEAYTIADAYAYAVLNWTGKFDIDLGQWPGLKSYLERATQRPAVQQSLREEGLIPG